MGHQITLNFNRDRPDFESLEINVDGVLRRFDAGVDLPKTNASRALALCLIEYVIWCQAESEEKFCFEGEAVDSPALTLMNGIAGIGKSGAFKGVLGTAIGPIFKQQNHKRSYPRVSINEKTLPPARIRFFDGNHIEDKSSLITLFLKIAARGGWQNPRSKFFEELVQKTLLPPRKSYFERINSSHEVFAHTFRGIKFENVSNSTTLNRVWPTLSHEVKVTRALQKHGLVCVEGPLVSGKTALALSISLHFQIVFYCDAESLDGVFNWVDEFEQLLGLNNPGVLVIADNCHLNLNAFKILAQIKKENITSTKVILLYRPSITMTETLAESSLEAFNFYLLNPSLNDLLKVYQFWHPNNKPFLLSKVCFPGFRGYVNNQSLASQVIARFRSELRALRLMAKDSLLDVKEDSAAGDYLHFHYCCRRRTPPDILAIAAHSANMKSLVLPSAMKEVLREEFRSGLTFEITDGILLDPVFAYLLLEIHRRSSDSNSESKRNLPGYDGRFNQTGLSLCIEQRMAQSCLCDTGYEADRLATGTPRVERTIANGCFGNDFIYSSFREVFTNRVSQC